jgi:HSP20 family protein
MLSLIPIRDYESMRGLPLTGDWMERMFNEMLPSLWKEEEGFYPELDIAETDEHIVVKADLPGIEVKDLDISLVNDVLTIRGERKETLEEKKEHYHRVERRCGLFHRSFTLPAEVKAEEIDAHYKDGVLTLSIPKSEVAKPKKIEVKVQ